MYMVQVQGAVSSELNACPGCGATWSCGGDCPIWGRNGSGWEWLRKKDRMNEALQQLAKETVEVQNAVNLIAVADAFARMVRRLRDQLENAELPCDTMAIRRHPITICWLDKMNSLADIQSYVIDSDVDQKIERAHALVAEWASRG